MTSDHQAHVLPRSLPGALGDWNPSTALDRQELLAGVEQVTARSMRCTRRHTTQLLSKGYTSPANLTAAITQQMREAKASGQGGSQALEALYGTEGAQAMRVRHVAHNMLVAAVGGVQSAQDMCPPVHQARSVVFLHVQETMALPQWGRTPTKWSGGRASAADLAAVAALPETPLSPSQPATPSGPDTVGLDDISEGMEPVAAEAAGGGQEQAAA